MKTAKTRYLLVERDFSGFGHVCVCMMDLNDSRNADSKFIGEVIKLEKGGIASNRHRYRTATTRDGARYMVFSDRSCRPFAEG